MNYKIQLISFLFSFIFGIFFNLVSKLNYKIVAKYPKLLRYIITMVFILDVSLLYVICMYRINYGVIHIYFILVLFIGFFCASLYGKKLRNICKIKVKKLKE